LKKKKKKKNEQDEIEGWKSAT